MTASNANVTPVVPAVVEGEVGFPVQAETDTLDAITSTNAGVAVIIFDLGESGRVRAPRSRR
jgi:hypothetical protein